MALESATRLVDLINRDNQLDLKPTRLTFGNPVDQPDGLSSADVTALPPGYWGTATIKYRRLGLDHLFSYFTPRVLMEDGESQLTDDELIRRIRSRYPVALNLDEVTITYEQREDGDYYIVTAKDSSLVYKNAVTIGTRPRVQIPISEFIFPDTESYVYPNNSEDRAYARIYSGGWYVPEAEIELSSFMLGQGPDENLVWLTTILSGDQWVLDAEPAEMNLSGALVRYNGLVENIELHPDAGFMLYKFPTATHVMLLELSDTLCTGLVGRLTYYYGVAENEQPDEVI